MAFFSLRKGSDDTAAAATGSGRQTESIDAMRKRAKHRLIGACVLVLVGVVGFPLLFDTQPRPISVDIPIEIPDRNKAKPLNVPAAPTGPVTQSAPPAQSPSASGTVTQAPSPATVAKAEPTPAAAPAPAPKAEPKPEPKPETAKPEAKPADDGVKAAALLEGKPAAGTPAASEGRYVVQVGAFSDAAKARDARVKLEHAGLKTYTQVVETKDGKRIRVRLGPYATKADADKAADKAKGLDMQPAVLTL